MTRATADTTDYIPGVCNINRAEIAYRRKFAYGGILVAAIIAIVLIAANANRWIRIVAFLPLLIGIANTLQVRNKFCVSYAASGLQNATEGSGTASKVSADDHTQDKQKARRMNTQAIAASLIITILLVLIPA